MWHKLLIQTQLKKHLFLCMSVEESVVNQISYCNNSGDNWLNMLFEDDAEDTEDGGEQVSGNQYALGTTTFNNQDASKFSLDNMTKDIQEI